jgi:murein DD-endopeptidase MepM/ murein hydrolase activator NlpD
VPGRAVRGVLVLLVVALAAGPVAPTYAEDGPGQTAGTGVGTDLDAVLKQVREELAESSEAMVRAAADLRLADAALPGAQETAAHAARLLATAKRRQVEAAHLRAQAQVRLILSNQQAEASAEQVEEQQARLGRLARAAYQAGGSLGEVSMLLEARSPADFAERLVSWQTVVSSQQTVLSDLETVQESFGDRTEGLEAVRDTLARADERAQRELRKVAELELQAREAEAKVGRLVAAREAALAAARAAQAEDDAAHARRESVSGELQAELAAAAGQQLGAEGSRDGSTVPPKAGTLAWPVQGRLSSPFGMRVHPITGVYKLHTGTDIGAPCGTPVRAARDGVVTAAGWNSAYGWRTVVSHGVVDGALLTTTYNHQQGPGAEVGTRVGTGQVIGRVGSTGYSTGCHLHFELYVNSSLVDPERWLPAH